MLRNLVFVLVVVVLLAPAPCKSASPDVASWYAKNEPALLEIYRELHANPELSFHEKETAARIAAQWKSTGATVTMNVGGHGVVAVLKNGEGPTLMLRTDLDALPVEERTGLAYASKVRTRDEKGRDVGIMHACGHDVHMTNIVGVSKFLASHRDHWQGTLLLIGQPAEERGAGAKAMLDDGLFKRFPRPDFAIALHVDPTLPTGMIGYRDGFALANVDSVDIKVHGKGGHGAYPHTTVDPIVQAAQLVLSLQTIVSREVKPIEPAVVTVGSIHGGAKHNVIGDDCHLQLTVRSYTDEVRNQILTAIERKAKAVAAGAGAKPPTIKVSEGTPALFNDKALTKRIGAVFEKSLGSENIVHSEPAMGGEDFSRYGKAGVPILMYRLGSVEKARLDRFKQLGQAPPSLHSPLFYPDIDSALRTGVVTMSSAARELLAK